MSVQPPLDRYPDRADAGAETVGPYQLVSQVALGELAALYEAIPLSGPAPARPLLVKRLVPKHARNPEYQAALRREAELSASLLSSDIVRTLNIESTPDLYSVMERIDGANLAVLLAQARQHDLETTRFAVPLIVGALRALDYLHRGHDPTGGAFLVHQAPVARHIMGDVEGRAHIIDLTLAMGLVLPSPITACGPTRWRPSRRSRPIRSTRAATSSSSA
jgi:serine/threonine protein kinase